MGILKEYGGDAPATKYIRGEEFEKGLELKVVDAEIVAANPGFGATEADYLFKQNILKEGETFRYTFLQDTDEGEVERIYDSKSAVFFISMKNLDPQEGVEIIIKRTGERQDTKYDIQFTLPTKEELEA